MNILVLCDKYLPLSEQFIFNQVKALNRHNLYLFCRKYENENIYPYHFVARKIWYKDPLLRASYKLSGTKQNHPVWVQRSLISFIKSHCIELLYIHYGNTAVQYAPALGQLNLPVITAFHGFDASRKLKEQNYVETLKKLWQKFSVVTVPSLYLRQNLEDAGLSPQKIRVVHYGVNLDHVARVNKRELPPTGKLKILHAGRIVPKKGVPDLVRVHIALAKADDNVHLYLVGDGEDLPQVRELVSQTSKASDITLTGAVDHKTLVSYLKGVDIFVLNSRTSDKGETEGLPNTIIEAMACGTAVVSTVHSGIPEIVENGKNGLLVPEKDNKMLTSALQELITNADLRKKLALEGKKTAVEKFSLHNMHQKINGIIEEITTALPK